MMNIVPSILHETIGQFYSYFDTIIFSNILHKIYMKIHLQTIELQQKNWEIMLLHKQSYVQDTDLNLKVAMLALC